MEKRGFDTTLNDFDNKISLGEMQRISLARALYLNREILLLDEVTSSLDKENTDIILQSLKEIKDKTIILISHQLKNVEDISFDYHYQFQDKKLELVEEIHSIDKRKRRNNPLNKDSEDMFRLFHLLLFSPILVIDRIEDMDYFFWFIEEMNNHPMLLSVFPYIVKDKARKDL